MITQEFLNNEKGQSILGVKDLDTTHFILSLYEPDNIDISEAFSFLNAYIKVQSKMEEIALKFIAHNFQYYKQENDTIIYNLNFDNVYAELINHSVLGFYALLKEFMPPYTSDWALKQISTYNPVHNSCEEQERWVSSNERISLEYAAAARMLASIICNQFDHNIESINKRLYKKLQKKDLALFFAVEEFKQTSGYESYKDLKNKLLT